MKKIYIVVAVAVVATSYGAGWGSALIKQEYRAIYPDLNTNELIVGKKYFPQIIISRQADSLIIINSPIEGTGSLKGAVGGYTIFRLDSDRPYYIVEGRNPFDPDTGELIFIPEAIEKN